MVYRSSYRECYCAFCKTPRKLFVQKKLNMFNYIQAFCLAGFASFLFWGEIDAKALVIFFIALLGIECAILIVRRLNVPCPHCGFDAYLYSKNKELASSQVKKHLEIRQLDPNVWLGRKPPLQFAKKTIKKNSGKSTKEIVI